MHRYAISDQRWARIAPLLPGKRTDPGRSARDNRLFIDAVLWIARTGAPWADLPARFGKPNSAFQRFNRWSRKGVWAHVHAGLQDADMDWLMLDSTTVRAHQHAAGARKRGIPLPTPPFVRGSGVAAAA